jgi:hypothetical protein
MLRAKAFSVVSRGDPFGVGGSDPMVSSANGCLSEVRLAIGSDCATHRNGFYGLAEAICKHRSGCDRITAAQLARP